MSIIDLIVQTIVAGATLSRTPECSLPLQRAYRALISYLQSHYPHIDLDRMTKQPDSVRGRIFLAEDLANAQADQDKLLLLQVHGLIDALHTHQAAIANTVGVDLAALTTAVVMPHDRDSLEGALLAAQAGLIVPVLVGDPAVLNALAAQLGLSLTGIEVVAADTPAHCASEAAGLARNGRVQALMKGSLHSDVLLAQVVARESALRGERRLSHVFVLDTPGLDHLLLISDAAINIAPDLMTKADIVRNAIDLARACGIDRPRVGILSAVETINPNIPSTLDAAILSKMAERGQIEGGIVDGPLAMDNAIDLDAARSKGIRSLVAGRAEVLIAPNLEAGNLLAKELSFLSHAQSAGLVMGARVPVMLTSRADGAPARLLSCALAVLLAHWQRTGTSAVTTAP